MIPDGFKGATTAGMDNTDDPFSTVKQPMASLGRWRQLIFLKLSIQAFDGGYQQRAPSGFDPVLDGPMSVGKGEWNVGIVDATVVENPRNFLSLFSAVAFPRANTVDEKNSGVVGKKSRSDMPMMRVTCL